MSTMQEVTMTVKVPVELRDAFLEKVHEEKRPASHIILDLMRAYAGQTRVVKKTGDSSMYQQQIRNATSKTYLCDDLAARAIAGQPAILEEMLNAGIPLVYCDEDGNMAQKNPDGTIEILEKIETV